MRNIRNAVIGILLLPFAVGFSITFYGELIKTPHIEWTLISLLIGVIIYIFLHVFYSKPNPVQSQRLQPFRLGLNGVYIFGHEFTHAAAALLFGGRVKSFKVSSQSGSVMTTKTNIFIELAPYFIPVYTLLLMIFVPVIKYHARFAGIINIYLVIIGMSIGMHLVMTAETLKIKQPDITRSGYVLALILIYTANIAVIFVIFSFLLKSVSLKALFTEAFSRSWAIYVRLWHRFVWR